jgi:tRNA-2-methylthio-N6-dimethylallyladenosine synthase
VDAGVREITLLGQNVNAYHGEGPDGPGPGAGRSCCAAWRRSMGFDRLRYTTSHPRDMDDDLIAAHRDLPEADALSASAGAVRVRQHLEGHEPRHTADEYRPLVDASAPRNRISRCRAISSSAFPARPTKILTYAQAFSFKYSPRPGTPAAGHEEQVPEDVKSERLARLQTLLNEQQAAFNRSCVGRTLDVLLEKPGRKPGQLVGRSPYLQSVFVDAGDRQIGETVRVEITETGPNSLTGHMVDA